MNKTDLVLSIIENVHLKKKKRERQQYLFPELNYEIMPKTKAESIINSLIEIMISCFEKGDNLDIPRFGRFDVEFKWARKGRNPKTGESIFVDSRRKVKLRYYKSLKDRINRKGKVLKAKS
ncbi:MAG: HU family DNA-binding protein [Desulfatiglans sp.]|nr:HU family DNA-binding protein [Desulfatiglans sp.]